ncbi:MAG: 2-amino-4-hydroxy-6-hydroxymethyldihydropteridine pyrophosphokinae [Myxococcaceae bacterium]|nr:2-amino-4-hydroxy-6-hydroxymethyldihydropteridine pyrophosphokinae [Myxococcaceae bacterium]
MIRTVIGLGANLGDRLATMRAAVGAIGRIDALTVRATSRVYATAPVGLAEQPEFLNGAVLVEYMKSPHALLEALLGIEKGLGRTRGSDDVRWGPRTIDLDVLWIDGVVVDEPGLTVPHPRLTERAFALVPLLEVVPHAVDPRSGAVFAAPASPDVRATSFTL